MRLNLHGLGVSAPPPCSMDCSTPLAPNQFYCPGYCGSGTVKAPMVQSGLTWMSKDDECYDPARTDIMGHFYFSNDAYESNCLAAKAAAAAWAGGSAIIGALTPAQTLVLESSGQKQSITPGLPSGYDPSTGAVAPSNITGSTQAQPITPGQANAAANPPTSYDQSDPNAPWYCRYMGVGCDFESNMSTYLIAAIAGLGLILMLGMRGKR